MAALTPIIVDSVVSISQWATTGTSPYLDVNSSLSYITQPNNIQDDALFGLTIVNTDFQSMDSATYNIYWAQPVSLGNDNNYLGIRVETNTGGTILAAATSGGIFQDITTDASQQARWVNSTGTFAYVNTTATEAQWNDAVVRVRGDYVKNAGPDNAYIEVTYVEIGGTYTQSAVPTTITPTGSYSAPVSATAQLTVTVPSPVTINPTGSHSSPVSATAQLTASYLPTTITPVGSYSQPVAAFSGLSAPGVPSAVSDLAGTPGVSGAVNLTWSDPI